jgi:hypothetical protein
MNKNTGLFDMALALSVNKINSQFAYLLKRKKVGKDWGYLTNKEATKFFNDRDGFAQTLEKWKATFDSKIINEVADLKKQLTKAIEEEDFAKAKVLNERIKALEPVGENPYKVYDYAMDAKIKSFKVELAKAEGNETSPFYFIIEMDYGTFYTKMFNEQLQAMEIKSFPFSNCTYGFKVAAGKKVITTEEMVLADEDRDKIQKKGITDNDFTIESLLMDFQNAMISQFVEEKTTIFQSVSATVELRTAITSFFMNLAKSGDNPFILGYQVSPKSTSLTPALFSPTLMTHSVTDTDMVSNNGGRDTRYQAFNFVMQTNNHPLPGEKTRGIMPRSLIEYIDTKYIDGVANPVNGVFAIDYNEFLSQYIVNVLEPEVGKQIYNSLYKSLTDFDVTQETNTKIHCQEKREIKHEVDSNSRFDLTLENRTISVISNQESKGLKVNWDIKVSGNQHLEVPRRIAGIKTGATGAANWGFSTNGTYPFNENGERGSTGSIAVEITASTKGTLDLKFNYSQPYLAHDTKKMVFEGSLDGVLETINYLNLVTAIMQGVQKIFYPDNFSINLSNDRLASFKIENFEGFSERVILPGSNTFTFKTVRLLTGRQDGDDAVLFDIAYVEEAV